MARTLSGVLAIVHTPFTDDDQIDGPTLRKSVDWAFSVGADGLGMGMVSETMKLTSDERRSLASDLVEFTAGRGPVFAAVGAESTKQSLEFATAADKCGCDAVMAVPPLTSRLSEAHLIDHFRAIADAISIPVIVQDASGYIGQAIPIGACVKLLERFGREKNPFQARSRAEWAHSVRPARRDGRQSAHLRRQWRHLLDRQLSARHRRHDAWA